MRTTFSNEELVELRRHSCVFSCTSKSINYTYEFKKHALEEYEKGVRARDIWKQAGFNTDKWKKDYFRAMIRDWKKIVLRGDISSLNNQGGTQHDDGITRSLKVEKDKIKREKTADHLITLLTLSQQHHQKQPSSALLGCF